MLIKLIDKKISAKEKARQAEETLQGYKGSVRERFLENK